MPTLSATPRNVLSSKQIAAPPAAKPRPAQPEKRIDAKANKVPARSKRK